MSPTHTHLNSCTPRPGSGKTLAYLIPIAEYIVKNVKIAPTRQLGMNTTAVIIAPTRELAHQITDAAKALLVNTKYGAQVLTSGMAARDISATLRKRCGMLLDVQSSSD